MAKRTDIRSDPQFREFFELDSHNTSTLYFSPIKIAETDQMPIGVRDFIYVNDKAWMFVALSDMKLTSRLDSYLTNVNLPWEKKRPENITFATVGALLFYRVGVEADGKTWNFTRLWAANYPS